MGTTRSILRKSPWTNGSCDLDTSRNYLVCHEVYHRWSSRCHPASLLPLVNLKSTPDGQDSVTKSSICWSVSVVSLGIHPVHNRKRVGEMDNDRFGLARNDDRCISTTWVGSSRSNSGRNQLLCHQCAARPNSNVTSHPIRRLVDTDFDTECHFLLLATNQSPRACFSCCTRIGSVWCWSDVPVDEIRLDTDCHQDIRKSGIEPKDCRIISLVISRNKYALGLRTGVNRKDLLNFTNVLYIIKDTIFSDFLSLSLSDSIVGCIRSCRPNNRRTVVLQEDEST